MHILFICTNRNADNFKRKRTFWNEQRKKKDVAFKRRNLNLNLYVITERL